MSDEPSSPTSTHEGSARMVDVGDKDETERVAVAEARVRDERTRQPRRSRAATLPRET